MRNFQHALKIRKRSFISVFSVRMTVPLNEFFAVLILLIVISTNGVCYYFFSKSLFMKIFFIKINFRFTFLKV